MLNRELCQRYDCHLQPLMYTRKLRLVQAARGKTFKKVKRFLSHLKLPPNLSVSPFIHLARVQPRAQRERREPISARVLFFSVMERRAAALQRKYSLRRTFCLFFPYLDSPSARVNVGRNEIIVEAPRRPAKFARASREACYRAQPARRVEQCSMKRGWVLRNKV